MTRSARSGSFSFAVQVQAITERGRIIGLLAQSLEQVISPKLIVGLQSIGYSYKSVD